MVIVIEQVLVNPTASVTVQLTVVIPIGYVPEASPVPLKSVLAASLLTVIGAACFLGTPVILAAAVGDLVLS